MKRFVLKIPADSYRKPHCNHLKMLNVIADELRRLPGVTKEEWQDDFVGVTTDFTSGKRVLSISQNHGIREKRIAQSTKSYFKEYMPEIIRMFPGMTNPFVGDIEFHAGHYNSTEAHFIPKPQPEP